MNDLAEFLLARIAEDEAEVGAADGNGEGAGPNGIGWAEVGAINEVLMARPSRVLADCVAKRRIVERHGAIQAGRTCAEDMHWYPCVTLKYLALPYADHPDYREEWRP